MCKMAALNRPSLALWLPVAVEEFKLWPREFFLAESTSSKKKSAHKEVHG